MPDPSGSPARSAAKAGPFLVGVTGTIGSGKSVLCRILAERHHLPIIDADRLGHEALGPGGGARAPVIDRFGPPVLDARGEIDRGRLAALVFRDPAALAALELLTHPVMLAAVDARVAALKESGYAGIILLDAAVLPRWLDRLRPDALVLVRARESVLLSRLQARGLSRDEARRRLVAQERLFPPDLGADWSIRNDGTMESLEHDAEALWRELAARFEAPGRSSSG